MQTWSEIHAMARLGIRLFDKKGGKRMIARVRISGSAQHEVSVVETKAGTTDLNDMPRVELSPGSKGLLAFTVGSETREMTFGPLGMVIRRSMRFGLISRPAPRKFRGFMHGSQFRPRSASRMHLSCRPRLRQDAAQAVSR